MSASATSSGFAKRPAGISASNSARSSVVKKAFISVSITPHAIAFTAIPDGANSLARAFVRIIKKADDLFAKLKYLAVAVGSLTILPDMLLKVDYGRWILAVVTYYLLIILAMLVLRDPLVTEETEVVVDGIKQHPAWLIYFTLVVLTVPYMDVDIDMLVRWLQRFMQSKAILFY